MAKIYVIKEGYFQALASDFTTFALLASTYWFNYKFIGDSYMMKGILLVIFIIVSLGRAAQKTGTVFYSNEALIEHLTKLKK